MPVIRNNADMEKLDGYPAYTDEHGKWHSPKKSKAEIAQESEDSHIRQYIDNLYPTLGRYQGLCRNKLIYDLIEENKKLKSWRNSERKRANDKVLYDNKEGVIESIYECERHPLVHMQYATVIIDRVRWLLPIDKLTKVEEIITTKE